MSPPPRVDGQAVIEGVMMRSADLFVVAVRRRTGEVVVRRRRLPPKATRPWLGQLPVLRGLVAFFDALFLGTLALCYAFVQASGHSTLATADVGANDLVWARRRTGATASFFLLVGAALLLPLVVVLGPALIDVAYAHFAAKLVQAGWPPLAALPLQLGCTLAQLACLPAYLAVVAQLPSLRRVCGYHGAEHQVRAAWAAGVALNVPSVRRMPVGRVPCTLHALWLFSAVACVLFFVLAHVLPQVPPPVALDAAGRWTLHAQGLGLRLVALLPAVALSFELGRADARPRRPFAWAGWLSACTLREPDAAMLEVALAALHAVLDQRRAVDGSGSGIAELPWPRLGSATPLMQARQARLRRRQLPSPTRQRAAEAPCCTS